MHLLLQIPNACVSASLLLAKIIADATYLASEISQGGSIHHSVVLLFFPFATIKRIRIRTENLWVVSDLDVFQGLLDAFPFADGIVSTQASFWSIIARLLTLVRESEVDSSFLNCLVSILARKFDLLEEEIAIHLLDDMGDDSPPTAYVDALVIGVSFAP